MVRYECGDCRAALARDDERCGECGSPNRAIYADVDAAVGLEARINTQARYGLPGEIKPHRRTYNEIAWSHDRQRMERRIMITDGENDYYLQEWRTLDTDQVTWRKEGKLSDPALHGESARRPNPPCLDE